MKKRKKRASDLTWFVFRAEDTEKEHGGGGQMFPHYCCYCYEFCEKNPQPDFQNEPGAEKQQHRLMSRTRVISIACFLCVSQI